MAEIRTVTTLRTKADEIRSSIIGYEKRLAQARADLAHVTAAIAIFEASGETEDMPRYIDVDRLWKRGEVWQECRKALSEDGPQVTRALAARLMRAKGLDTNDAVLHSSVTYRTVQALRMQEKRGKLVRKGKQGVHILWSLPPDASCQPKSKGN